MAEQDANSFFVFPKWTNTVRLPLAVLGVFAPLYFAFLLWYASSPAILAVGYAPVQPSPYSHAQHAGKLGLACRYCHTSVEKAGFAAIPATQTCMNCHTHILPESPKLALVRESFPYRVAGPVDQSA